jgi:DNA-binding IclR family transcriptional regulator
MSKSIQAIERAFSIIELLGNTDCHLGISVIAAQSDLPLATTHRVLTTLSRLGYVEQNPETNKYTLGVRILQFRGGAIEKLNLGVQAMPIMKILMNRVRETVHLAVLNKGEVVYIERVEGLRTQGMYTRIGKRGPAHCTALGKAILANADRSRWFDDVVHRHGLKPFSATTITTVAELEEELEKVRKRGYAIDNCESGELVRCVAAPIRDYTEQVVAALSISGPQKQITVERLSELGQSVSWAADLISRRLGYDID